MSTATTPTRKQQAEAFLAALFDPDDLVEIRPIECWVDEHRNKRSQPRPGRIWRKPCSLLAEFDILNRLSDPPGYANPYLGVCPRPRPKTGEKKDIEIVRSLWADIDDTKPDEALFRIDEVGLPRPSIAVNSGHGTHVYWLLAEAVRVIDAAVRDRVEGIMKRLREPIRADATQDLSRVLRLPGTWNVKDARNGAPRAPVVLVELNEHRYTLEEIGEYLPPPVAKPPASVARTGRGIVGEDVRELVRKRLEQPTADRSKRDFHVICDLVQTGYAKEVIREMVMTYSKFADRDDGYFDLTFNAAVEAAEQSRSTENIARLCADTGNAARFVLHHRHQVKCCVATGKDYMFDAQRWRVDDTGQMLQLAKRTVLSIFDEAKLAANEDHQKGLAKWAIASQRRERIMAMIALARPELAVTPEQLDADPWAFNVRNGTLDLRTAELRLHSADDLITKLAPVEYQPDAECPLWLSVLRRAFADDEALMRFVQRFHGMALTGDVREQILAIYHGKGGNGKNVILDTITSIMGDYAGEAPPNLLTATKHQEHPTEVADLMGKRLIVASETEDTSQLKLQLVKRLTGNARIKARFMRQDYFEFDRTFKLVLVTNNKPIVNEDGEAAWRRLRLVPFNVVIPKEERDTRLLEKLKPEWPGILAWMVRGCLDWQREGLGEPDAVRKATAAYRDESDLVGQFLDECCETGELSKLWTPSRLLRHEYEKWSDERGVKAIAGKAFAEKLKEHGCVSQAKQVGRGWAGVRLTTVGPDQGEG